MCRTEVIHSGRIFDLVGDAVDLGDTQVLREYVAHPGAVAVIALDEQDRVLLLSQYRHPVRSELWEPPAGLLDVPDEELVVAAARGSPRRPTWSPDRGGGWSTSSPRRAARTSGSGCSWRVTCVPWRTTTATRGRRGGRDGARVGPARRRRGAALSGRLHSPTAVTGVLAAAAARARGWSTLEPV